MTSASSLAAGPASSRSSLAKTGFDWVLVLAILAVLGACIRVLLFTPFDVRQGAAYKIFYIHVPAAIAGLYLSVIPMAITSAIYLWIKDERLDRIAESLAEVGLVFMTVVLTTGPLWGKPIWGTWWTWDARITSTLFLWFVLVGYLVLRGAIEQAEERARLSAVIGALAGLLVPFIHLTVYMFNTLHPMPVVLKPSAPSLSPEMLTSFQTALAAFALFFFAIARVRYRWATARDLQQLEDQR
jgi:heme exporter protein C